MALPEHLQPQPIEVRLDQPALQRFGQFTATFNDGFVALQSSLQSNEFDNPLIADRIRGVISLAEANNSGFQAAYQHLSQGGDVQISGMFDPVINKVNGIELKTPDTTTWNITQRGLWEVFAIIYGKGVFDDRHEKYDVAERLQQALYSRQSVILKSPLT